MEVWIQTDGVRLWSERIGESTREVILLVAGANASAMMWPDAFIQMLVEAGYSVLRYDHRDTGRSTRSIAGHELYTVADFAGDAIAVLDAHRVEKAHLLGVSMGGTIGQLLAIERADRLNTLAVMLTAALDVDFASAFAAALNGARYAGGLPAPDPEVVAKLGSMFAPGDTEDAELERRVEQWRILSGDALPFDADDFRAREMKDIEHSGTFLPPTAHARAIPVPVKRGQDLAKVTTPTLVIQGGQDPLNPPPHGAHIASLIAGAQLVEIPELGHALPTSLLSRICDVLLEFLRGARR